jgi:hypothetical protein
MPPETLVLASLDKTCPKCGSSLSRDMIKRLDFEIEYPKCGERFQVRQPHPVPI